MIVTPFCNYQFQSHSDLDQLLTAIQQELVEQPVAQNHDRIISISQVIDWVDPLIVLDQFAKSNQLNFYFEKREFQHCQNPQKQGTAIAAIGAAAQYQIEGSARFSATKTFIHQVLSKTVSINSHLPFGGPHFFCSFRFFDQVDQSATPFPAATIFLPQWQIACQDERCTIVSNLAINASTNLKQIVTTVWHTLKQIRSIKHDWLKPVLDQRELLQKWDVSQPQQFQQAVRSALTTIESKALNKVVLAHAVDVNSPLPFHLTHSLDRLRMLYPDCHIFLSSNGNGQHFIGASPERLISLHQHQLTTDALAGSAPRGKTTCEDAWLADRLLNHPKERHEHRVVSDFITQQLTHLGLAPHLAPLRLLQLSNIQHLHTPIHAIVPPTVHLLDIVAQLHPTPAVAGVPRSLACELIRQSEPFDRSLYAAPIGWMNHQGEGEFIVGIRSALIHSCQARLFAGAGIVAGSNPARELAEVQLKLQALLAALV
jgi:menaquinone-specific isochorismate synthase